MNPQSQPIPLPSTPAHILVLDDERDLTKILREMLSLRGYAATACHSAGEALELVARETFDLILSDYRMPMMNGKEFFQAALRLKPDLARRILFLTGDSLQEETQAFLRSTGTPYLAKPFHFATLEKVVANMLQENLDHEPASADGNHALALCA
jgi:CheY-like chemotaxis protein